MPNIAQMRESNFLKKEDVGAGALMTIKDCAQENVAKEGAPQELKWCLYFQESEKPLVLNTTNTQMLAKILGSDETDDWTGKKVVLYNDPNVSYAGKIIGGIRVRAPRGAAAASNSQPRQAAPAPTHRGMVPMPAAQNGANAELPPDAEDDVPF